MRATVAVQNWKAGEGEVGKSQQRAQWSFWELKDQDFFVILGSKLQAPFR